MKADDIAWKNVREILDGKRDENEIGLVSIGAIKRLLREAEAAARADEAELREVVERCAETVSSLHSGEMSEDRWNRGYNCALRQAAAAIRKGETG